VSYNLRDLRLVPIESADPLGIVGLQSPKTIATFTHWGFSQMSRLLGAPAAYLRSLPADIAAAAMNHGIGQLPVGTAAGFLVQAPNGNPTPTVRTVQSTEYARIWDADLYGSIAEQITDRDPAWQLPPTWSGEPAGAYRGDRDSFLIVTNGGSIVEDPSLQGRSDGQMYRGLMVRNSEVGASSITIEQILFRFICGNHMLWGAVISKAFRRRHVGKSGQLMRDTLREIGAVAYSWANESAAKDQAIIRGLISHEIAQTKAGVVDELRAIGYSQAQAETAYDSCERSEEVSPRSFWGIAQGTTRASQISGYQDDRYVLDQLAAKVLSKGARLVTV
jgi:hypothetical protein